MSGQHRGPERGSQVAAMAEALAGLLTVARSLHAADRPIALHGLADMVGRCCAQALDLPPADGAALVAPLQMLLAQVDTLRAALVQSE